MFKCQQCGKSTKSNQPENKVIMETRDKNYENTVRKSRYNKQKFSNGWEIVKEIRVCPKCYKQITGQEPLPRKKVQKRKKYKGFNFDLRER